VINSGWESDPTAPVTIGDETLRKPAIAWHDLDKRV
jgi:hypothetical protein